MSTDTRGGAEAEPVDTEKSRKGQPRRGKATAMSIEPPPIGLCLARLRKARNMTLASLAERSGVSEATLSRVENGVVAMSAHNLYILAKVLGVDITTFFRTDSAPFRRGLRSVTRAGSGETGTSARYRFELLCADISHKRLFPSINTVTVRTLEEAGGLQTHEGEELVHVLEGRIDIHSELYRPERLSVGDSMYLDSSMGHAYVALDDAGARILVVTAIEPGTASPGA